MIALSILQKEGFTKLTNVSGGVSALVKAGLKLEVPEEA
jgi:rhodanese-related sulfurtransferase